MTPAEELIIVSDLMAKISRKLDLVSAENADLRAKLATVDARRDEEVRWCEKYVAELRSSLAAAEKARDEQAEAVRVLAHEISEWRLAHVCSPVSLIDAPIIRARKRTANNPIAAAAVKEAGNA